MNDTLTPERQALRESVKGMDRIGYCGAINKDLIEDFLAVAPEVQMLTIDLLDNEVLDLSMFTDLKELLTLKITEGFELKEIKLDGIQKFDVLMAIEINVNPEKSIEEIDLTPLANHPELGVVTIACPVKNIKGFEALGTLKKLNSIGFYSLNIPELDLTSLSDCPLLESIYLGDMGPETPTKPYRITLPQKAPIKILEVSECFSEELELEIDFTFLKGKESFDSLSLVNCNLTSFDFNVLTPLQRIGKIDLTNNKITHLDITPILEMPMFTEKALGEAPFVVDEDVVIQISKSREQDAIEIIGRHDKVIDNHEGSFAIEYEFGHKWLKNLIDSHTVEWI
ncbi:MAG: hypothetical protein ACTSSE_00575 [Candidatus Thorarchaeota archaeon]